MTVTTGLVELGQVYNLNKLHQIPLTTTKGDLKEDMANVRNIFGNYLDGLKQYTHGMLVV